MLNERNMPQNMVEQLYFDWADIWVGYFVEDSPRRALTLHLHFSPETEAVQRRIHNILRPFMKFRSSFEDLLTAELIRNHDDVGCGTFLMKDEISARFKRYLYKSDYERALSWWLREVFKPVPPK